MKKSVRIISAALAVCVMISVFLAMPATALTEESAAQKGPEVFEAWNIINYSNYDYMMNKYISPYRLMVDELRNDPDWNSNLMSWRVATFDLKSELSYAEKEIGYYDTFLFNILYDTSSASMATAYLSYYTDSVDDVTETWKAIGASAWKDLCEADLDIEGNVAELDLLNDTEQANKVWQHLQILGEFKDAFKIIGDATKYMGYCKTVLELVEKISQIEALIQNSQKYAEVLLSMYENCDGNLAIKKALAEYAAITNNTLTEEEIVKVFTGEKTIAEVGKEFAGLAWQSVIKAAGSTGLAFSAGQSVGKFTADLLFGASTTISEYYKLTAMYEFEDLMKTETLACQKSFQSNPTEETAKRFIAAYKMMFKTYIEGLDCTSSYIKAAKEGGLLNKCLRNTSDKNYQSMQASIASIKSSLQEVLGYIDLTSNNYFLDVLDAMDAANGTTTPASSAVSAVKIDIPVTETDIDYSMETIQDAVFEFSNPVISEGMTLTEDLTTYGSLTISKGTLDLNGHTLTVYGDFNMTGGALSLLNGTLTVKGNLQQSAGSITLNHGKLAVDGDYRIQRTATDSAGDEYYTSCTGTLRMQYEDDRVVVGGDFVTQSNRTTSTSSGNNLLSAGTMAVAGNFEQIAATAQNFVASGTHTVILNGTGTQRVSFESPNSNFNNLQIDNSTGITFANYLNVTALQSDATAKSEGLIIDDFDLNGHILTLDGDVGAEGAISLLNGTLTVKGNLQQSAGSITLNHGKLAVDGDYRIQRTATDSAGDEYYTSCTGTLRMQYEDDRVVVGGDFVTQSNRITSTSSGNNLLSAGTMAVAGNFTQLEGSSYNFQASGTHTVILNGTEHQYVSFASTNSHFNILKLTQPRTQYTFNPEPCWNELQENVVPDPEFDSTLIDYGTCGNNLIWTLSKDGLLHIYGTGDMYDYKIGGKANLPTTPWMKYRSSINQLQVDDGVSHIGNLAFSALPLKSIELPYSVTSIGDGAFSSSDIETFIFPENALDLGANLLSGCKYLKDVILPSKLTSLPDGLFFSCTGMTEFQIPDGITYIGQQVFYECTALKEIIIPDGVTSIGKEAFRACTALKEVSLPNALTEIGSYAFARDTNITDLTIPDSVTTIGNSAFWDCDSITEITVPDSVVNMGGGLFEDCSNLKSAVLPNRIEEIPTWTFYNCTSLENINIPNTVTVINNWAFRNTKISSISLPDRVTTINEYAFAGCSELKEVVIPENVVTIGKCAFYTKRPHIAESQLTAVWFTGDTPTAMADDTFTSVAATVYYPANNGTWTEEVMQDYGGALTWIPYEADAEEVSVTGVAVSPDTLTLTEGESSVLTATIVPANATNKTVIWSSSTPEVASVNGGVVTAVSEGTAIITAVTEDGEKTDSCQVTVLAAEEDVAVTGVTVMPETLTLTEGETGTLTASVAPTNATNKTLVWSSSNPSVATVNDGVVTAMSAGATIITATTEDGGYTANCTVTVTTPVDGDQPTVAIAQAKGRPGETVDVSIILTNNPGIITMILEVGYDSDVMTLINVTDAGILGNAMHTDNFTMNPYQLTWNNGAAVEDFTTTGDLVTLSFLISEDAEEKDYPITLTCSGTMNYEMDDVEFAAVGNVVTVSKVIPGDVNGDSVVNIKDSVFLQRYIAKFTGYDETTIDLQAADVNGDGAVNIKDSIILQRYVAKWSGYEVLPH